MALIQCPECGKEISDRASYCIHCGFPLDMLKKNSSKGSQYSSAKKIAQRESKSIDERSRSTLIISILVGLIVILLVIFFILMGKFIKWGKEDFSIIEETRTITRADDYNDVHVNKDKDFPSVIEYRFIDYTDFSQYWFDGVFRCGTDFNAGDYYILPLFGAGAMYDVSSSPNEWSWSNYRCLRKVSAKEGDYVNVENGAIMVSATEVDTNNWGKYGVYLVGRDILAGEYKMETITDTYCTDLYNIEGISGAYQLCNDSIEDTPVDSNYLFESQKYITLENGQYILITNIKLTNAKAQSSVDKQGKNTVYDENEISDTNSEPETINLIPSSKAPAIVKLCIECGKDASHTYTNPFSHVKEDYCEKHYQEIIDIMSMMESDVGSSKQNKHTCEQCSKEGTHRYDSFTGQTEYYCTQHYEELTDMLESFGLS